MITLWGNFWSMQDGSVGPNPRSNKHYRDQGHSMLRADYALYGKEGCKYVTCNWCNQALGFLSWLRPLQVTQPITTFLIIWEGLWGNLGEFYASLHLGKVLSILKWILKGLWRSGWKLSTFEFWLVQKYMAMFRWGYMFFCLSLILCSSLEHTIYTRNNMGQKCEGNCGF